MSVNIATSKIITNEAPLVIPPSLAARIGWIEATILQQIHYYIQRSTNIIDGFRWVYNTYSQWQKIFPFVSDRTIRRAITHLESLKFIRSERMEASNWCQRKWYTVCYETLNPLIFPMCPDWPNGSGQSGHIDPANLDASYTEISTKDSLKTTDTKPTLHPVQEVKQQGGNFKAATTPISQAEEKESVLEKFRDSGITEQEKSKEKENPLVFSDERKIDPQLKKQVEEVIAPAPMNPQIKKAVLAASLEAVQDAIAVVQQRKEAGRVKNPAGLFVKAVKEQWKPSGSKEVHDSFPKLPEDFNEWFELARKKGLVIASSVMDGVLCVCTRNEQWEPYEEFRSGFSLPWLKRSLAMT
jgi:hypothetical protein